MVFVNFIDFIQFLLCFYNSAVPFLSNGICGQMKVVEEGYRLTEELMDKKQGRLLKPSLRDWNQQRISSQEAELQRRRQHRHGDHRVGAMAE
jgi:hypothetical protein